jgi:hypothetical protein
MKSQIYLDPVKNLAIGQRPIIIIDDIIISTKVIKIKDFITVVDKNEVEYKVTQEDLFLPYVIQDGKMYYLSLNWRDHLVLADLKKPTLFHVPTEGSNKGKAIKINSYCLYDLKGYTTVTRIHKSYFNSYEAVRDELIKLFPDDDIIIHQFIVD